MARKLSPVEAAHRRVAILQAMVKAERQRAESNPFEDRNGTLGIVSPGTPHARVRAEIASTFDELEAFLNHLGVAHVAASFEGAAKDKLKTVIGEARKAVEKIRKDGPRWPADLVRSLDTFDGLAALGSVIPFEEDEEDAFGLVRAARNTFSHSVTTAGAPAITSDEAAAVLSDLLDRIKI